MDPVSDLLHMGLELGVASKEIRMGEDGRGGRGRGVPTGREAGSD
jgi:hypothetical protein